MMLLIQCRKFQLANVITKRGAKASSLLAVLQDGALKTDGWMEPTQTLPTKSTLTSPSSFKHIAGKKTEVKFDFKHTKNILAKHGGSGGSPKIFQRRMSDKQKPILQPLKMLFDTDPLHLLPLMNRKPGTDSPELVSTPLEKKEPSSPVLHEPLNITDPLNLIYEEQSISRASRKRKKKRLRCSSLCLDDDVVDLHESHNESLPLVSPTETYPKLPKLTPTLNKSDTAPLNNFPASSNGHVRNRKKNYKHGNYIHVKMSGLEYKPLGQIHIPPISEDQRVQNFKFEWFKEKDCLEIGCGEGYIAHWISKHFHPSSVVGIDIDSGLINIAKSKNRDLDYHSSMQSFPSSLSMTHGPLSTGFRTHQKTVSSVDKKISFICDDFVPTNNVCLEQVQAKYDTIIFLNTSKWIHLNHGDDGLRRTFKKIFLQLKPGGKLLFEPQTFNCYKKSKNVTVEIRRNFDTIKFMPTDFITYLLSTEVGFTQSLCLAHTRKKKTSNARPLYLLTKGGDVTSQ